MIGKTGWTYSPYKPFLFNTGDIYICRVVPGEFSIHFEWIGLDSNSEYTVYLRKKDDGNFEEICTVSDTFCDINGLVSDTDYEFYVSSGCLKSRVRIARTGKTIGVVVNYLHPDDMAYSFSGNYLCSPSMVRHPDGYLLASMDVYGPHGPQNLSIIFRSDDDGDTWHYVSELMPCFWGKMFIHKKELYMMSCSTEYGDLLIGKSTDGGKTFTTPTVLMRGSCNSSQEYASQGVHKSPMNIMVYNGRIYETLEWGSWYCGDYGHAAMIMSCDENDDLLDAKNWHFTEPVVYNPEWPGVAKGPSRGNIEGTLCVSPDGVLYNVMRYEIYEKSEPSYGMVLAYRVNTDDPDAPLEYSHPIMFNGNLSKFLIKYDEKSEKYYSIVSRVDSMDRIGHRNLLSLLVSDDMENWKIKTDLYDFTDKDHNKVGLQYVDFDFEGDDILYLCRTAMNNANSYHNSNYITFHRIKNFRSL